MDLENNANTQNDNTQNGNTQNANAQNAPVAPKKPKKKISLLFSILLAAITFLCGGLTTWLLLEPEMRSLILTKEAIDRLYYKDVDDEIFYKALFGAVNGEILDDYSWYMTADEFEQANVQATGSRSGIGVVFLTQDENKNPQLLITSISGNSPAEAAGLEVGSYVVGFGSSETEIKDSVLFSEFSEFLDGYAAGEEFFLKVRGGVTTANPTEQPEKIVRLAKSVFTESYVFYRTNQTSYRFTGEHADVLTEGGAPLSVIPKDAAYIRLKSFNGAAAKEFDEVMKKFRADGKKHLVLDLRGNGGGYLDIMQDIAKYFCKTSDKKKPTVAIADYGERKHSFEATANVYYEYFSDDSRVCVLADEDTASASECLIGCMVDYGVTAYSDICLTARNGRAKTFGKGIMQTTYPLVLGGGAIKLTTAQIIWPKSGHCIHGRGILPEDGAITTPKNAQDETEIMSAIQTLFA